MRFLIVLLFTVVSSIGSATASGATTLATADVERIESRISQVMTRQGIPGLSVAISLGERQYVNGFGHSDVENFVPTRATTVYRTASIAKPMTSAVVMRLVEAGQLDLDAPVQKYCPDFPQKRWPVTSRQLLGHLSGIRHYRSGDEATGTKHYFSVKAALPLFADDPLLHEPNTKFLYTTYGFNLLGAVAESAASQNFVKLLTTSVLTPSGMLHTGLDDHFAIVPSRSRGYIRYSEAVLRSLPDRHNLKPGQLYNATLHDTSMKVPGGGLVSTAPDLVRFAVALNEGRILSPQTLHDVWTRQVTANGEHTNYGLGWRVSDESGQRIVSHGGGQAGTATYLRFLPEAKIYVAVMCNLQGAKLERLAQLLAECVQQKTSIGR